MKRFRSQRMSIFKVFSTVNYKEFVNTVRFFKYHFATYHPQSEIEISLYKAIPSSITSYQECLNEDIMNANTKLIFLQEKDSHENIDLIFQKITKENFTNAAYVKVTFKDSTAFACLEFKGLLPKHVILFVDPIKTAEKIFLVILKFAPLGLFARFGDGMEKNHHISYS